MTQREVIEIQKYTKGTRVVNFFGTDHSDFQDLPIGYLLIDAMGKPIRIVENDFDLNFKRLPTNSFTYDSSMKHITGRTSTQTLNYQLTEEQKGLRLQNFIDINKAAYGQNNTYWSQFSGVSVNDMYANVSFIKSYNTLNTLSVLNTIEGEPVLKESPTGVLFGKLESIQKINDENGNKLRIPLANVPVAIFKTTEEFPDISSTDEDGNRIVLNLKENSKESEYFNNETYEFAQQFLTSTEQIKNVPEKYRYTALTNEKGEFIIYDVPVGAQTFMLEIDLLKQGLTKDEVALNNFPYQTTENPNVDSVPHLFFRQFTINVVPSWGDLQSGYTQLNITVPIDLRKWTTYIFPPVAFGDEKLENTVARNASRKLKIEIRDMTTKSASGELFPKKTLSLVKIDNDIDRDENSQYIWYNEFTENRRTVEYSDFSCYVIKMPANLYDPEGYRTNSDGVPTKEKGVWLTSYQFKEYIDAGIALRTTGGYSYWTPNSGFLYISHFDLNYTPENGVDNPKNASDLIGSYPYEKPWSINYPSKYSIASKPVIQRFVYGTHRVPYSNGTFYMEEPAYEDGDLVGLEDNDVGTGGFGLQYIPDPAGDGPGTFFPNRISQVATKNFMYKYEKDVAWNETYASGYEPFWNTPTPDNPFAGWSKVKGGERFQRLECGYGYFMKPQGWPRYVRAQWGVDIPTQYIRTPTETPRGLVGSMYSPKKWFNDVYNLGGQNLALALNGARIKQGSIDIYRIVESGIKNILPLTNFVIPTYCRLKINRSPLAYSFSLTNTGEIMVKIKNRFGGRVYYYDKNSEIKPAEQWEIINLYPGKFMFLNGEGDFSSSNVSGILYGASLTLPGNSSYNTETNQYTVSNYNFRASYKDTPVQGSGSFEFNFSAGASTGIPTYWVRTSHNGSECGVVSDGISRDFKFKGGDDKGQTYNASDKNPVVGMFYEQYGDDLSDNHGYYVDCG